MCGTELDPGERYCHRCGTMVEEASIRTNPVSSTPSLRVGELWKKFSPTIMLMVLIAFASYLLWQHTLQTEVKTYLLDDYFYSLILSKLHASPTASWYGITSGLYGHLYGGTVSFRELFPMIFYVWLIVPDIGDLKWLYFVFALAGVIASYCVVFAVTKRSLIAAFSGAWMVYFLETGYYLMLEYWAVSVFLVGLAFFLMNRHVLAAVAIGAATLIRLSFAPFMVFASVYYLAAKRKEWAPSVYYFLTGKRRGPWRVALGKRTHVMREVYVWVVATGIVGLLYIVNNFVGLPASYYASAVGLNAFKVGSSFQFEPGVLWLLFSGGQGYFLNPPIPLIVTIALALIGIAFLDRDQSIILFASFAALPLLVATSLVSTIIPGVSLAAWRQWANIPSRWIAMSITMVNLFWWTGAYKICERVYYAMSRMIRSTLPRLAPHSKPVAILD